jgi:hypothetical protein
MLGFVIDHYLPYICRNLVNQKDILGIAVHVSKITSLLSMQPHAIALLPKLISSPRHSICQVSSILSLCAQLCSNTT